MEQLHVKFLKQEYGQSVGDPYYRYSSDHNLYFEDINDSKNKYVWVLRGNSDNTMDKINKFSEGEIYLIKFKIAKENYEGFQKITHVDKIRRSIQGIDYK